jgi:hypothetical protein
MTMMKKQIAALVVAASVIGGVGVGVAADALTDDGPAAAARPDASSPSAPARGPSDESDANVGGESGMPAGDDLTLAPGSVGPVRAGMSKAEALATGYFVADVKAPAEGCPMRPLSWKDEYVNGYDVQTRPDGSITSIGIRGQGIETADGLQVGSALETVQATYPDAKLVEAGYDQSGILVHDTATGGWIGFLFDHPVAEAVGSDRVSFIEITQGAKPSLMRDGC